MQKNLDQSCVMAADDFVFSVDYWFGSRLATSAGSRDIVSVMREPWLFAFGAVFVIGSVSTLLWTRNFERRKNRLGWAENGETFGKRHQIQLAACVAAAIGTFVTVAYGLGLPPGAGRTGELGLILILIPIIWVVFRKDIARYQYQIAMTMFGKLRPEQDQEQHQIRAMESFGIAFSVLLFITGIVLLTLNLAFS